MSVHDTRRECEEQIQVLTEAIKTMEGFKVLGNGSWFINRSDGTPHSLAMLHCFPDTIDPRPRK